MPGPSSRATMTMPGRPSESSWLRTISPVVAYSMMLRASSEMAVAITVRSLPEKPSAAARARPRCRAVTMSADELMGTTLSARGPASRRGLLDMAGGGGHLAVQEGQAFLQVEGGGDVLEGESELDHRERHLWLDAD